MERKIIPGFSLYYITSDGVVTNKWGRVLSDHDCNGYRRISLRGDNGKRRGIDVHRLVATTWIGPIPSGYWVNHENGVRHDNRVENLRIDTPGYNHSHAFKTLGRKAGNLKAERREAAQVLRDAGWSTYKIARGLGCSQPNVVKLLSSKSLK